MNRTHVGGLVALITAAVLLWPGSAGASGPLKDPDYTQRKSAFKKATKFATAKKLPEAKELEATVEALALTRDARVFKDLVKSIRKIDKGNTAAREVLDEITHKLNQVYTAYFKWFEDEWRRTGQFPTTILIVHRDAMKTYVDKQRAAGGILDRGLRLRDAIGTGLAQNLEALGDARAAVWKDAIKLGTSGKSEERAAICHALGDLGGDEAERLLLKIEAGAKDPEVALSALAAMAACESKLGFPRLVEHLGGKDETLVLAAIRGLSKYRHPRVLPALIEGLKTIRGRNFEDLSEALFSMTGKRKPDAFEAWDRWWKNEGRQFLQRWSADVDERQAEIERISFTDPKKIDVAAELGALLTTEPEAKLRLEILENISIHRSYYARMTLLTSLRDKREDIRLAAIRGLAHYRHLTVPQALMDLVEKAGTEEVQAIFQALRKLWGGESEFSVSKAEKEALLRWWALNKDRVPDQLLKLGAFAMAAGKPVRRETDSAWRGRDFYGITIKSSKVLFVVDISISMEEPQKKGADKKKIDVAKSELSRAIKALPDGGKFGLVCFSGLAEVFDVGMMPVKSKNRKSALAWIEALKTRAATNIYDSMELAFKLGTPDSPVKSKGLPDTIFLVSDGAPTVGKFIEGKVILEHIRRWNKTRRVKIHAIGVGEDHDVEFLQTLAHEHGGSYVAR